MNEFFRVYNDSAILNRALEFPVTVVWIQVRIQRGGWGSGGMDPRWKITSYVGFYRE